MTQTIPLGASPHAEGGWQFLVWAPHCQTVAVKLVDSGMLIPMQALDEGYFYVVASQAKAGDRYFFRLNDVEDRPDPTTRAQPDGVHGASQLIDPNYAWKSPAAPFNFMPAALRDMIIYELHVGTFTPEGTFEAVIPHLARLRELGINAIELLPIAHFPGKRGWGYDGVNLFAAHTAYGGVHGLKALVDAAHLAGVAVIQDVVYNHFGPEGNYLARFGDYFTDHYRTPWGSAVNLDGRGSAHVRRFLIESALHWLDECRIDGLRLDATQELYDMTPLNFLAELTSTVRDWEQAKGRRAYIIAESNRSDRRKITPVTQGGYGLDAVYLDDIHHTTHYAITDESMAYLKPHADVGHLTKILTHGFYHSGDYSPELQRRHGSFSGDLPSYRFLVSTQNHDYTGNRAKGDRMSLLTDLAGQKLAAGMTLLSPYLPMLFMGEEYGESAPFLYFIDHGDQALIEAVREGRKREFAAFMAEDDIPDPDSPETFKASTLNQALHQTGHHALLHRYYGELLRVRRELRAITNPDRTGFRTGYDADQRALWLIRSEAGEKTVLTVWNLHRTQSAQIDAPAGSWRKVLDSSAPEWVMDAAEAAPAPDMLSERATLALLPLSVVVYVENSGGNHSA